MVLIKFKCTPNSASPRKYKGNYIFKISLPRNKIHHNLLCISTSPRLHLIKQFLKLQTWRDMEWKKDIIFINEVRALMISGFLILFFFILRFLHRG